MMKNKTLHFGFFGALLVIAALCAVTFSVKAHAAPSAPATTTVHAYIVKTSSGFVYKRTAIITLPRNAFEFVNDTALSQTVTTPNGNTVVTIPAHMSAPYTFTATGHYKFSLASNATATLTVTVS